MQVKNYSRQVDDRTEQALGLIRVISPEQMFESELDQVRIAISAWHDEEGDACRNLFFSYVAPSADHDSLVHATSDFINSIVEELPFITGLGVRIVCTDPDKTPVEVSTVDLKWQTASDEDAEQGNTEPAGI